MESLIFSTCSAKKVSSVMVDNFGSEMTLLFKIMYPYAPDHFTLNMIEQRYKLFILISSKLVTTELLYNYY